jgi:general L-amino acid transport system permease protein
MAERQLAGFPRVEGPQPGSSVMRETATKSAAVRRRPVRRRPAAGLTDIWFSTGFRYWAWQALVLGGVLACAVWLIGNAQDALGRLGVATGFGFLLQPAGFDIGETPIAFNSSDTFLKAYVVAVLNTLKVSAVSIVLATVIGVVVGLARLSSNALIRGMASAYIELFRNTPQLLQLIFWYALVTRLPGPREAVSLGDVAFVSNRGLVFPWPSSAGAFAFVAAVFLAACLILLALRGWAARRYRRTGEDAPRLRRTGLVVLLLAPLTAWLLAGAPSGFSVPQLQGFNFRGGMAISPEFLAMLLALSLYIGAFIAEIVRSGIRSVPRGQLEAARAIGLRPRHLTTRIVLPQALRVMIPPATAQYVSLIKNSSLGVAIGYPELFNINNSIITLSGRTVEAIGMMMAIYLSISLTVALLMNLYNRHVQIVER